MEERKLSYKRNDDLTIVEGKDGKLAKELAKIYKDIQFNLGFCFEQLQKGIEKDELIAKMISEYDVTKEKASADIDIFINKLKDANVFE